MTDMRLSGAVVSLKDINVDDVYMVMSIFPYERPVDTSAYAYVAFVKNDGSLELVRTEFIENTEFYGT